MNFKIIPSKEILAEDAKDFLISHAHVNLNHMPNTFWLSSCGESMYFKTRDDLFCLRPYRWYTHGKLEVRLKLYYCYRNEEIAIDTFPFAPVIKDELGNYVVSDKLHSYIYFRIWYDFVNPASVNGGYPRSLSGCQRYTHCRHTPVRKRSYKEVRDGFSMGYQGAPIVYPQ